MASIDLERLDIEQLPELLAKAQTEMAIAREAGTQGFARRARTPRGGGRLQDGRPLPRARGRRFERRTRQTAREVPRPAEPRAGLERHWTGPEVGAGDPRRTRHRHGRLQVDPDVSDPRLELSQRARGRTGGRRGRVEAVPKRGAAREVARTTRAPEISRNRGEHPDPTHENRACCEIAPPPGRSVPPRAAAIAPSRSASPARGRGERSYPAAGPRAPATTGAGCARSLGSVRQRSNAVTHRWGIPPGGRYPHVPS